MNNLELAFKFEDGGNFQAAENLYFQMLRASPQNPLVMHNLGRLYWRFGFIDKAVNIFRQLVPMKDDAQTRAALGNLLLDAGETAEALNYLSGSERLFAACHLDDGTDEALHNEWGAAVEPLKRWPKEAPRRIGYLSPHFRTHTVTKFLLPALTKEDYCYSDVAEGKADAVTDQVKRACGVFRDVSKMTDKELVKQLDADGIEIVVDLTGHLGGGKRTAMIAGLPRTYGYIGYPRNVGTPNQIRISDWTIDPNETSEPLIRVRGCAYAYRGDETIAVADGSHDHSTCKVFGSVNRPAKYTDALLAAWSRIIAESGGRLRLLIPGGEGNAGVRRRVEAAGVPADRLELFPKGKGYWDFMRGCDLILDAFAYSGHTTVCDAMWAGVPIISLPGKTPQSRVGASVLNAVVPHWVASSVDEYVSLAVTPRRWLRGSHLRQKMNRSDLGNGTLPTRLRLALGMSQASENGSIPPQAAKIKAPEVSGDCGCRRKKTNENT